MKNKIIFTLLLVFTISVIHANEYKKHHTVNSVLGDISFIEKYGKKPDANTDEVLRIKTHLEYVENLLRSRDVSRLTGELKDKREQLLDLLHDYRLAGHFPKNYDYPGIRIPCFIDKEGNICAVGYLIEQTSGRAVAEDINANFQYHYLLEMKDEKIDDWIRNSGLTAEECAMIQPGYGYEQPPYSTATTITSTGVYSWTVAPSKEEIALKKKVKELEEEKLKLHLSLDSVRVEMKNLEKQSIFIQNKLEADVKNKNSKINSLNQSHENEVADLNKIIYLTSAFGLISLLLAFYFFFKKKKKIALA